MNPVVADEDERFGFFDVPKIVTVGVSVMYKRRDESDGRRPLVCIEEKMPLEKPDKWRWLTDPTLEPRIFLDRRRRKRSPACSLCCRICTGTWRVRQ